MLADFVGEVVSSMVGDGIVAWLFPGISKPQPSPREGEWNASLGSLSAFLAGIAPVFCALATFGVLRGISDVLLWLLPGGSVLVAIFSAVLAHRALEATSRRRALAKISLWLSRTTICTGLLAAVLAIAGVTVLSP